MVFLSTYSKRDNNRLLFCYDHSAGRQICTEITINWNKYFNINCIGFVDNVPLGGESQCSIENAFGSGCVNWSTNVCFRSTI